MTYRSLFYHRSGQPPFLRGDGSAAIVADAILRCIGPNVGYWAVATRTDGSIVTWDDDGIRREFDDLRDLAFWFAQLESDAGGTSDDADDAFSYFYPSLNLDAPPPDGVYFYRETGYAPEKIYYHAGRPESI